ncbi:MAG: hypothetical protein LBN09_03695 [Clostridioides sp.]|nr:hypothetical protein [Clostridioides sp.]
MCCNSMRNCCCQELLRQNLSYGENINVNINININNDDDLYDMCCVGATNCCCNGSIQPL